MAGIIDYGSRLRRNRNASPEPSDRESTSQDPFSETSDSQARPRDTQTETDPPYGESTNQEESGYDGYTEDGSTQMGDYGGGHGGHKIDTARMQTTAEEDDEGRSMAERQNDDVFFDPTFPSYEDEEPLEMVFFDHVVQDYGEMGIVGKTRLFVRQSLSFGLTLAALGGILVLAFAHYFNPFKNAPKGAKADREYERRITGERLSGRPEYYSEFWGYHCDTHDIITEGGWILKAHRVSDPRRSGPPGHPVILQHGILCNSSHFFVCEERSMAFWMVDQGYDVWVTNIRANFESGHTEFSREDPRFWAWGLKELAFDLRDVVEFVCGATGKERVAYCGHSQGSGSMYLALSPGICPQLGHRLSCFVAFGPSVYAGPVLRRFPFSLLRTFRSRYWWSTVFGVKEFIPALGLFQKYMPSYLFGHLAWVIFSYLFNFHDHNWIPRQKPKIFRTVPVPTSSELLYWYMASFSHRGVIFDPRTSQPWFPRSFPGHAIIYGDRDFLVLGKPLVERMERYEKNVNVLNAVELQGYEHLDFIMGIEAYRTVYPVIRDTIEATLSADERPHEMMQAREGGSMYGSQQSNQYDDDMGRRY